MQYNLVEWQYNTGMSIPNSKFATSCGNIPSWPGYIPKFLNWKITPVIEVYNKSKLLKILLWQFLTVDLSEICRKNYIWIHPGRTKYRTLYADSFCN